MSALVLSSPSRPAGLLFLDLFGLGLLMARLNTRHSKGLCYGAPSWCRPWCFPRLAALLVFFLDLFGLGLLMARLNIIFTWGRCNISQCLGGPILFQHASPFQRCIIHLDFRLALLGVALLVDSADPNSLNILRAPILCHLVSLTWQSGRPVLVVLLTEKLQNLYSTLDNLCHFTPMPLSLKLFEARSSIAEPMTKGFPVTFGPSLDCHSFPAAQSCLPTHSFFLGFRDWLGRGPFLLGLLASLSTSSSFFFVFQDPLKDQSKYFQVCCSLGHGCGKGFWTRQQPCQFCCVVFVQGTPLISVLSLKLYTVFLGCLWTRTLSQAWACVKYGRKQSLPWQFEPERYHRLVWSIDESSPFHSSLNTNVITGLGLCKVWRRQFFS